MITLDCVYFEYFDIVARLEVPIVSIISTTST